MSKFITKAIELQPFMTCSSEGDPNPEMRSASVKLAFVGPDAIEKAHALHDAIVADVQAAHQPKSKK